MVNHAKVSPDLSGFVASREPFLHMLHTHRLVRLEQMSEEPYRYLLKPSKSNIGLNLMTLAAQQEVVKALGRSLFATEPKPLSREEQANVAEQLKTDLARLAALASEAFELLDL